MHKKFYIRLIVSILFICFICVLYNPSKQEVLKITDTRQFQNCFVTKRIFLLSSLKKDVYIVKK